MMFRTSIISNRIDLIPRRAARYVPAARAPSARSIATTPWGKTFGAIMQASRAVPAPRSRNNSPDLGSASPTTRSAIGAKCGVTFASYAAAIRLYSSARRRTISAGFTAGAIEARDLTIHAIAGGPQPDVVPHEYGERRAGRARD